MTRRIAPRDALRRLKCRYLASREVRRLAADPDAKAQAIARALQLTLSPSLEAAELARIDRIEHLRRILEASNDEIVVIDYGAGSPTDDLSPEAMAQGRAVTYRLRDLATLVSMPRRWALLLFQLVRQLQPQTCLELGTAMGISAAYQAAALELNGSGRLISLEGAPDVAEIARRNLRALDLTAATVVVGRFADSLPSALETLGPLEYALVDGHHDRDATIEYFLQLLPSLTDDAVVVFDDIDWSSGMREAWQVIREHGSVRLSVDTRKLGLTVVGPNRGAQNAFRVALN